MSGAVRGAEAETGQVRGPYFLIAFSCGERVDTNRSTHK